MIDSSPTTLDEEVNDILESITHCIDRGEGKGMCHVFIDYKDVCQCGQIDLARERMK